MSSDSRPPSSEEPVSRHVPSWSRRVRLATVLGLASACIGEPAEYRERRLALEAEFKDMDARLSEMEVRLLWAHERVSFWSEVAQRQQRMSEIACRRNENQLEAMFEHLARRESDRVELSVRDFPRSR